MRHLYIRCMNDGVNVHRCAARARVELNSLLVIKYYKARNFMYETERLNMRVPVRLLRRERAKIDGVWTNKTSRENRDAIILFFVSNNEPVPRG